MNRHDLPSDLKLLDPARTSGEDVRSPRAQAILARVIASGDEPGPAHVAERPSARWPVLVGATAAVVAVLVLASALGGRPEGAFATWTAVPSPTSAADARELARRCAEHVLSVGAMTDDVETVLAERRGDLTYTAVLDMGSGELATCLDMEVFMGGGRSDDVDFDMAPAAGNVTVVNESGVFSDPPSPDNPAYTGVTGQAGPGVEGIEIHTPDGRVVTATISDGWWGAWWPGFGGPAPRVFVRDNDGSTREVPSLLRETGMELRY